MTKGMAGGSAGTNNYQRLVRIDVDVTTSKIALSPKRLGVQKRPVFS